MFGASLSENERGLMREIRSCQQRAAAVERRLQQTKVAYALALQKRALAQVSSRVSQCITNESMHP